MVSLQPLLQGIHFADKARVYASENMELADLFAVLLSVTISEPEANVLLLLWQV